MEKCDVLVIGAGPGGTPAAMALASMGKKVILVEAGQGLGGTCLFEGCIPSKIIRESARRLRELRMAKEFGIEAPVNEARVNWQTILQRKARILQMRSQAARHKGLQIPGFDLRFGRASLLSPHEAAITLADGSTQSIGFEQAIIATGSRPNRPPIPGIDLPGVLDSEQILSIESLPERLTIIGAGPIGVELGQMFNSLGTRIHLLEVAAHVLGPVDEDLARQLQQRIAAEGIDIDTGIRNLSIEKDGDDLRVRYTNAQGEAAQVLSDRVLQVTGRHPNLEGLGLENTAIEHNRHGIHVNETLETDEPGIYATGDVLGQPMFAHWATAQSLALAQHLAGRPTPFPRPEHNSAVIFSEPELGMAGLTEKQAREQGIEYEVARYDFRQDARAQIMDQAEGLLKILFERDSRKVIGVHALVEGAGELMGEAALLVRAGLPIELIAGAIHPHPTLTESFAVAVRAALASRARGS